MLCFGPTGRCQGLWLWRSPGVTKNGGVAQILRQPAPAPQEVLRFVVHYMRCVPTYPAGGEKSFTTVSFLLALGHCTESPFRCLDEYDVFMDPAVRHVATETLLEFAREQSEYQYVLLTPQVGAKARGGARARL